MQKLKITVAGKGLIDTFLRTFLCLIISPVVFHWSCTEWNALPRYTAPIFLEIGYFILILLSAFVFSGTLTNLFKKKLFMKDDSIAIEMQDNKIILTETRTRGFRKLENTNIIHKLNAVCVTQGFVGSRVDTGTITLSAERYNNTDTETVEVEIEGVANPFTVRDQILALLPTANDRINIQNN